jgi:integrase/recombinase XerD
VFRHNALTQKSAKLKEHVLRQYAGWSPRSQMHLKYLHYFGNESSESLLESYGIVTKNQDHVNLLKPKQCPNCNEPNKPDSKFCAKCRMVLTYDAYNETIEEKEQKDKDLQSVRERMADIENMLVVIQPLLQHIKPEMLSKLNMVEIKDT